MTDYLAVQCTRCGWRVSGPVRPVWWRLWLLNRRFDLHYIRHLPEEWRKP